MKKLVEGEVHYTYKLDASSLSEQKSKLAAVVTDIRKNIPEIERILSTESSIFNKLQDDFNRVNNEYNKYIGTYNEGSETYAQKIITDAGNKGKLAAVDSQQAYNDLLEELRSAPMVGEGLKKAIGDELATLFPQYTGGIIAASEATSTLIDETNTFLYILNEIKTSLGGNEEFDNLVESLTDLKMQFMSGRIEAEQYLDALNDKLLNSDFKSIFGDDIQTQEKMFVGFTSEILNTLNTISSGFSEGKMKVTDYTNGIIGVAKNVSLLTDILQSHSQSWLGSNSSIDTNRDALDATQNSIQQTILRLTDLQDSLSLTQKIMSYSINEGTEEYHNACGNVQTASWSELQRFDTGGIIRVGKNGGLAIVDDKERVLTEGQTQSFDKLIDMISNGSMLRDYFYKDANLKPVDDFESESSVASENECLETSSGRRDGGAGVWLGYMDMSIAV